MWLISLETNPWFRPNDWRHQQSNSSTVMLDAQTPLPRVSCDISCINHSHNSCILCTGSAFSKTNGHSQMINSTRVLFLIVLSIYVQNFHDCFLNLDKRLNWTFSEHNNTGQLMISFTILYNLHIPIWSEECICALVMVNDMCLYDKYSYTGSMLN